MGAAGGPMRRELPRLIEAMSHPSFYPERPRSVEMIQTHISFVFLAGNHVYKIKKPVRFPFMSCATVAERYRFCADELRLNRRLAPDIYIGVFPIFERAGGFRIGARAGSFDSRAVEYAVKMRRLPGARMLDRLVANKAVDAETIRKLARKLAAFHREVSAARSWTYGCAAAIWRKVTGELEQDRRFVGHTIEKQELDELEEHCRRFTMSHWQLLNDRARQGRVREGHGDLRCESVCLTERIVIFDCLEFSERLRYCDVASEIAFLAMDLDRRGAPALADELVSAYAQAAGDENVKLLVPFYKCYRAGVRGKVESLRSLEVEVPTADRERARETARQCFSLAIHYARATTPALLVVCGHSGTGKSTVARLLQLRTGFEILNSDRVRKKLAGVADTDRSREGYSAGIYAPDFTRRTYDTMLSEAERRLRDGRGIIVDATFGDPAERTAFLEMAYRCGAPALFIECQAQVQEVMRRLREREHKAGEVSDATAQVYLRQLAESVPMAAIPERSHVAIDTTEAPERVAHEVEAALIALRAPAASDAADRLSS